MQSEVCARCGKDFDFDEAGGKPDDGIYEGLPLCRKCLYPNEEQMVHKSGPFEEFEYDG